MWRDTRLTLAMLCKVCLSMPALDFADPCLRPQPVVHGSKAGKWLDGHVEGRLVQRCREVRIQVEKGIH